MSDEPRRCANTRCGAVLTPRPGTERPHEFQKRRTCSVLCGRHARRTEGRTPIVDEKPCRTCNTTMRRNTSRMGPKAWADKHYCSVPCATAGRTGIATYEPPVGPRSTAINPNAARECVQCGGEFRRRIGTETTARFAARECCGRVCAQLRKAALRSEAGPGVVLPETKPCEQCGTDFPRPPAEGPKRWAGRRYCSPTCAGAAKRVAVPKPRKAKAVPRNARTSIPVPPKPPAAPAPVWRPAVWIEHDKARAS